jgi:hypothetical protein
MDRYQLPTKAEEQEQLSQHEYRKEIIQHEDFENIEFCLEGDEILVYDRDQDTMEYESDEYSLLETLKYYLESMDAKKLAKVAELCLELDK